MFAEDGYERNTRHRHASLLLKFRSPTISTSKFKMCSETWGTFMAHPSSPSTNRTVTKVRLGMRLVNLPQCLVEIGVVTGNLVRFRYNWLRVRAVGCAR